MTKVILGVVKPGAVEAAVLASEEEGRKQDEVVEALRRDLEAARYAAQRAQRQYDAADPLCVLRRYVALKKKMPCSGRLSQFQQHITRAISGKPSILRLDASACLVSKRLSLHKARGPWPSSRGRFRHRH